MRLTPAEKQDIIRYLDADKPLPDKYRFLLFEDKREVELVWNGKTNEVCNLVLPFQVIEQVDEPRAEKVKQQTSLFNMDDRGRQLTGWTNKLIWGENKIILSSLKNGPLREEIEAQGGIKLIYIDPPFDVGADFSMDIEIGDDTFTKKPNILEEIAYRDTWGKGADSFISMIYERLILMRDLLAEDGSIYVHCDWRVDSLIKLAMDEVFGPSCFVNEIVWKRKGGSANPQNRLGVVTDSLIFYSKTDSYFFQPQFTLDSDEVKEYIAERFTNTDTEGRKYRKSPIISPHPRPNLTYEYKGIKPPKNGWSISRDIMEQWDRDGKLCFPRDKDGRIERKIYLDEYQGQPVPNLWTDIFVINPVAEERLDYPTQKPESLLQRVLEMSSQPGDLVADFFCGSGTTAAVAEKLNRKWICSDLGKFAIHTTRKRLIGVQRGRKKADESYRAFEILNLGKYERQHFIGVNPNLREEEQRKQLEEKEAAFLDLILKAYKAEKTDGLRAFHGKKAGRMVVVGPVNLPVTRLFVEEIILECRQKRITKVDLLGFEFEMGLFPNVLDEAKSKGIDISPKYIPADVFDKRAVEKNQVVFHDVAFIEVKPLVKGKTVAVQLTDFSVFYSQDRADDVAASLKEKGSKIVVEKGQIVKISKDKKGIITRERLTKEWTDWIDYWSVDFDFESKREIIRVKDPASGETVEQWTGDYIFENEWQSFRTKKDRNLELTSAYHETAKKRVKVAVKVVDIFGNDTMTIVDVNVGGKR
jgi:adenine-specific DNA-methyltransferase